MYRVEILPTAWEDLKQIVDWYTMQFGASSGLKVIDHILATIGRLEMSPKSGSLLPDPWLNEMGYRMVICDKHVAIYRQIADAIYLYHIADTRTECTKLFF